MIPDGRITYEKNGETFYIPYSIHDVVNMNEEFKTSDKVRKTSFFIALFYFKLNFKAVYFIKR